MSKMRKIHHEKKKKKFSKAAAHPVNVFQFFPNGQTCRFLHPHLWTIHHVCVHRTRVPLWHISPFPIVAHARLELSKSNSTAESRRKKKIAMSVRLLKVHHFADCYGDDVWSTVWRNKSGLFLGLKMSFYMSCKLNAFPPWFLATRSPFARSQMWNVHSYECVSVCFFDYYLFINAFSTCSLSLRLWISFPSAHMFSGADSTCCGAEVNLALLVNLFSGHY